MANDKEKQDKVAEEVKVKAVGGDAKTVEGEKKAPEKKNAKEPAIKEKAK